MHSGQLAENVEEQKIAGTNELAVERTMLALEHTQLAWIRTIIGLLTAGVAIDRGAAALHEARVLAGTAWVMNGHAAGLTLAISGLILIILTTLYYRIRQRELHGMLEKRRRWPDSGLALSLLTTMLAGLAVYFLLIS